MRSPRMSRELLYVPLYLRSFNVSEKIIVALLIFTSSIAVGSIPLILSSTQTPEPTTTKIYSSEAELWKILEDRK